MSENSSSHFRTPALNGVAPWDDGETEVDETGRVFFDFGVLCLQPTTGGMFSRHIIRITPPDSWEPQQVEYEPFLEASYCQ